MEALSNRNLEIDLEKEEQDWVHDKRKIKHIERIPGDASLRRYYRVLDHDDQSYILMKTAPFEQEKSSIYFLEVQSLLKKNKILAPDILEYNAQLGTMLLEDLGDETLLHNLSHVENTEDEVKVYKKVLLQLIEMQNKITQSKDFLNIHAYKIFFDFDKLMWEVNYTLENFYENYLKRPLKDQDKKLLVSFFENVCKTLASQDMVFVHRDFHSRNIMVKNEKLYFIDFQDARQGCIYYDLASILKDSYYQLSGDVLNKLLKFYYENYFSHNKQKTSWDKFNELFDLMSVQRNFKAIGSFSSFAHHRGDYRYVKYIGNTFENIRRVLLKYPEHHSIKEVLSHYYYF